MLDQSTGTRNDLNGQRKYNFGRWYLVAEIACRLYGNHNVSLGQLHCPITSPPILFYIQHKKLYPTYLFKDDRDEVF